MWELAAQIFLLISIGLPVMFVFAKGMDRICIWIFDRHKNEVFTVVSGMPEMDEPQKEVFKKLLDKANHNCDRWYEADLSTVDALFTGKPVNLLDINRLYTAASWQSVFDDNKEYNEIFDQACSVLWDEAKKLDKKIEDIKEHEKLVAEQDIAKTQIHLARLSTIAAFCSAVAALSLAYMAHIELQSIINR